MQAICVTYKLPINNTERKHDFVLIVLPWMQKHHFPVMYLEKKKEFCNSVEIWSLNYHDHVSTTSTVLISIGSKTLT